MPKGSSAFMFHVVPKVCKTRTKEAFHSLTSLKYSVMTGFKEERLEDLRNCLVFTPRIADLSEALILKDHVLEAATPFLTASPITGTVSPNVFPCCALSLKCSRETLRS